MSQTSREAKLAKWGLPVPPGLKHGQATWAAKVYGCPCKLCLPSGRRRAAPGEGMAHAERQRRLRYAKRGTPVPPGTKHGVYAYNTYGCRCDICVQKTRRQRRQGKSWNWLKRATGHYAFAATKLDGFDANVIHWPPVGEGQWTCPDCGQQFPHRAPKERTIAA